MSLSFSVRLVAATFLLCSWPVLSVAAEDDHAPAHEESQEAAHGTEHAAEAAEIPKGPHGGKLFAQDDFSIELVLYETGVPPEFHAYAAQAGKPLGPDTVELNIELTRIDGQVDHFRFTALNDFLRGQGVVYEPHSFDVVITAKHAGKTYRWAYPSYEGRTQIPKELAIEAGIEIETAGPVTIAETLNLTGRVQTDPAKVAQVRARFAGMVQSVNAKLGERVQAGEVLARIQSNESLQSYALTAPIEGVILRRDTQAGMATGAEALFVIADLSQVWVELDVFARQIAQVKTGQAVRIETLDGQVYNGRIDWLSSLVLHASQSIQARVILDNSAGQLRPGQLVRAQVTVAEHPVALAVRQSAIQGFRDFQVVFARFDDTYEVRMLELGKQNSEWAEVLSGLKPGTEYVTGNSYLIKADIDKSGASHDH